MFDEKNLHEKNLKYYIPISMFEICKIDNKDRKYITSLYPTRKDGAYYLDKFENYLFDIHNITLKDYIKNVIKISWPKCPVSGEEVGFRKTGKGVLLSKFKKNRISRKHSKKFNKYCEKISIERRGSGNPMYKKTPWNKNKDKRNPIIKKIAEDRVGIKVSAETREKQSNSAKKRIVHGHSGKKHSDNAKRKMSIATAKRYKNGLFKRESGIHIKVREFLKSIDLKEPFKEEYPIKYFSLDFAFEKSKVCIEVQGTFFHIDPRVYPNGPICNIQRKNYGRDKKKRQLVKYQQGWNIIEIWETEINNGLFKNILLCKLQELNLLNQ